MRQGRGECACAYGSMCAGIMRELIRLSVERRQARNHLQVEGGRGSQEAETNAHEAAETRCSRSGDADASWSPPF